MSDYLASASYVGEPSMLHKVVRWKWMKICVSQRIFFMVLGYKLFQDAILVLQLEKLLVVFHMSLKNDLFWLLFWEMEGPLFVVIFRYQLEGDSLQQFVSTRDVLNSGASDNSTHISSISILTGI